MRQQSSQIILAVESAISGGSLSLLVNGSEVSTWIGSSNISKAEDLLANINEILSSTGILLGEVDLVAVSSGPGSFTGIRIGLATALGLRDGLGILMSSESALKAMVASSLVMGNVTAAVPAGRNSICMQRFLRTDKESIPLETPETISDDGFFKFLGSERDTAFLVHESIYQGVDDQPAVSNFGANIAKALGQICRHSPGVLKEPLFIGKSF